MWGDARKFAISLGDLCEAKRIRLQTGPFGSQLHKHDYVTKGVPVVPTEAIGPRRIRTDGLPQVSEATAMRLQRHRLQKGDILFARRGVQATGLSGIVENDLVGGLCGTGAILLRVLSPDIDPQYVSYCLAGPGVVHWIKAHAVGAVMPNVNEGLLRRLTIPLPPLDEQRRIADILRSLDDRIELNRRMNQTLEAMARAIFKSWFIDFDPVHTKAQGHTPPGLDPTIAALFPDSFHDSPLGLIPTGWRVSTVGDEFQLTMGQSPPGSTYNEAGAGIPFFQGRADFGFRYPTNRVYCTAPTRFADKHDTLVSVRAPVGDINLAAGRCAVGRGVAAVRHNGGSRSYTYHGMHTLSDHFARYEGEGTVFGSINRKGFTSIAWLAPEDGIIDAFEQTVHPIDEQVEVNIRQSMTLATLRDALLPKLLCGELRVRQIQGCTEGAIL